MVTVFLTIKVYKQNESQKHIKQKKPDKKSTCFYVCKILRNACQSVMEKGRLVAALGKGGKVAKGHEQFLRLRNMLIILIMVIAS